MAAWRERVARLCMAVADYLKQGYSIGEARRIAAVRFGSSLSSRGRVDDQRSLPVLEDLLADLHHALRGLRRTPDLPRSPYSFSPWVSRSISPYSP